MEAFQTAKGPVGGYQDAVEGVFRKSKANGTRGRLGLGVSTVKRNGNHPVSRSTGDKGGDGNPPKGAPGVCNPSAVVAEDR